MQEYDAILKRVLTRISATATSQLIGSEVARWLNVELPQVRSLTVDLLAETSGGRLIQIELQSSNDPTMSLRMLEYAVAIYRKHGRRPEQMVLYVGEAPVRMSQHLAELAFDCRIVDIRQFDPEPLLDSPSLADNVITILMQHPDRSEAIRRLLRKISGADPQDRATLLNEVFTLAGLRKLAPAVRKEVSNMPILDDIMDHELWGPALREAKAEGRQQGEYELLRRQIEKRFGQLPPWALTRLESMNTTRLEAAGLRILDATSLEELLNL